MSKWKLIKKDPKDQPNTGVYTDWKEQIASECYHQCVYCAINEKPWGGIDHYHIDHFRPKSKPEFKHLENDILNLFYACPVCNRFKSDDWPAEPNLDLISYPDPSQVDYSEIFCLDTNSFVLVGLKTASKYIIERLYLNRPQLVYERHESFLMEKEMELIKGITEMIRKVDDLELIKRFLEVSSSIREHLHKRESIRPYKLSEIRKS